MTSTTREAPTVDIRVSGLLVRLELDSSQDEFAEHLRGLWAHVTADAQGEQPGAVLRYTGADEGSPSARRLPDTAGASYTISGDVTRAVITSKIGTKILLHAGAVDHPRLGMVVLVGASGAGKSTAAIRLGEGGGYLSDELAIIDPDDFALTAYPKPVSTVQAPGGDSSKHDIAPAQLGLAPVTGGGAPDLMVLVDRIVDEESEVDPHLERVPLAEALPLVIAQSSSLWALPGGLDGLARLLTRTGGLLRARYREAEDLEGLLASPPPALVEDWDVVNPVEGEGAPVPSDPDGSHEAGGDILRAAPYVQALRLDTGILVMRRHSVIFLPSLVGLVWDELEDSGGLDAADLEARIVAEIGDHPDSALRIAEVIGLLQREGWVLSPEG